ncbi:MAG: TonB-dependent siderophore receptor [Leptolyngbya sp. SIO1E4]|nr:TonB-dependent siderophore receptor [Leptolyngbya sp. SIO1E4]
MAGGAIAALPAVAQDVPENDDFSVSSDELTSHSDIQSADTSRPSESPRPVAEMPSYPEIGQPATTLNEWMAQIEASIIQIVGVRVEETETGLQIVLETAEGELATPITTVLGNAAIAEIPNAVLVLPEGDSFEEFSPAEGIALVQVTALAGDRVQVAITGTDAPPVVEVTATGLAVKLGEVIADIEDETIQIVVTGQEDEGYNPSSASTATRTDTPLRDIPQSITVVPRQVLEDRNVRTVIEGVETVSSVAPGSRRYGSVPITSTRIIRGFDQRAAGVTSFRNGFPDSDFYSLAPITTVEKVEVLRGPASVLFGAGEPGGIVNVITRQPLDEPYYNLAFEVGNYGLYQPSIDLSGPLTENDTALYRFIASYQSSNDFQDFADNRVTTIAPSVTLNLGERTELDLYYEYTRLFADPPSGLTNAAILNDGSLTPRDFATYYPDLSLIDVETNRFGYTLEHEFSNNLRLRNNIAINLTSFREDEATGFALSNDDRFLGGVNPITANYQRDNFFGQVDLLGKFETGSISHQILAGFDFNRYSLDLDRITADTPPPPLDINNPNYDIPVPNYSTRNPGSVINDVRRAYGIYLQDQIAFSDNLKLLIGGRYDWTSANFEIDLFEGGDVVEFPTRNDSAFSPRVGLVYQPIEEVALYASYTRSFSPLVGFDNLSLDDEISFEPTKGTQYEVGVKTDFLDGRLSATLAAYHLTRTNVLTPDPADPTLSIQTGEQRSQGIELDVTGEILPGWNVILSYAYTDAEVTEDNTFPEGNRLPNVPENQASLWTTYTIQEGDLEGLGFGLGLFYVGARQGDLNNSFELEDYLRTDAALYYRRDRFNAAINFRNLFDIDAPAFAFSRAAAQRTEPFSVVGSISWEF